MEVFFFWLLFSVLVAMCAGRKGRSELGFFVLSIIISPLPGLLFALVVRDLTKCAKEPTPETHVKRPDRKEFVLKDARKCKHCINLLLLCRRYEMSSVWRGRSRVSRQIDLNDANN